jgi:hypothetical protein
MLMHNSVALLSLSLSGWTDEAERPSRETTIYIGGGLMDAWALFFFFLFSLGMHLDPPSILVVLYRAYRLLLLLLFVIYLI